MLVRRRDVEHGRQQRERRLLSSVSSDNKGEGAGETHDGHHSWRGGGRRQRRREMAPDARQHERARQQQLQHHKKAQRGRPSAPHGGGRGVVVFAHSGRRRSRAESRWWILKQRARRGWGAVASTRYMYGGMQTPPVGWHRVAFSPSFLFLFLFLFLSFLVREADSDRTHAMRCRGEQRSSGAATGRRPPGWSCEAERRGRRHPFRCWIQCPRTMYAYLHSVRDGKERRD